MLRAGFVGFGRMGITHFSILNTHPSVKIISVCDQSKTMMGILKKYMDVEIYSDYQEMIDRCKLDFVVVSTPADSHSKIIQYALDKDLHLFCEKPFVLETKEGDRIIASLKNRKIVNQIGYVNRFNSVFMEVKRLLQTGIVGEVKNFGFEMYGATVLKDTKGTWRSRRDTGGGCMNEFASHCIDLVTYLIGVPDRISGSVLQRIYSSQVEDLVCSTFSYNNGINGNIKVNWSDESFRRPTNIITIFGNKGKILADKHAYKIYLRSVPAENGYQKGWNSRYITDLSDKVRFYVRGNEFTRQLDYFIDCIKKGSTQNISSFSEAFETDKIMQQILVDARESIQSTQKNSIPAGKERCEKLVSHRHPLKFWRRNS